MSWPLFCYPDPGAVTEAKGKGWYARVWWRVGDGWCIDSGLPTGKHASGKKSADPQAVLLRVMKKARRKLAARLKSLDAGIAKLERPTAGTAQPSSE